MAQYLLSVWHDGEYEVDFTSDEVQHLVVQVGAFNERLAEAGAMVFGCGLLPASTATVTLPDGTNTPGPYSDGTAQMGGFWIIEADTPDAAQALAAEASAACEGPVELRPLQTGDE